MLLKNIYFTFACICILTWTFNEYIVSLFQPSNCHDILDNDSTEYQCRDDKYVISKNVNSEISTNSIKANRLQTMVKGIKEKNGNKMCSNDLTEIEVGKEVICIKISKEKHIHRNSYCYGSDILNPYHIKSNELEAVIQYLKKININKFWLPVKRKEGNYSGFFIKLPGQYWNHQFEVQYTLNNFFSDKNCLAATLAARNLHFEHVSCSSSMHSVCIFREPLLLPFGCKNNFFALKYSPMQCFGTTKSIENTNEYKSLSVTEYFKHRKNFKILLKKFDSNNYFIAYSFYTPNGKKLYVEINNQQTCRITSVDQNDYLLLENVKHRKLKMKLGTDIGQKKLFLTVYNGKYIWKTHENIEYGINCFLNDYNGGYKSLKLKKIWEARDDAKLILFVNAQEYTAGYYWCESHSIHKFELIRSETIYVNFNKNFQIFSSILNVPFSINESFTTNFLYNQLNNALLGIINNKLRGIKYLYNFEIQRIYVIEILNFSKNNKEALCLTHIEVSPLLAKEGSLEQSMDSNTNFLKVYNTSFEHKIIYNGLYSILSGTFNTTIFIKSTEYCFAENFYSTQSKGNYWNEAKIGEIVTPGKLCLSADIPLSRKCLGNFKYGAYWEVITPNLGCDEGNRKNNITELLFKLYSTKLYKTQPENTLSVVLTLINDNIDKLIPADLYYIAVVIRRTEKYLSLPQNTISPNKLIKIINLLFEVNENVVQASVHLNSTNKLLYTFEKLIDQLALLEIFGHDDISEFSDSSEFIELNYDNHSENKLVTIEYEDIGVVAKIASNLLIFAIDPKKANVTGVALIERRETLKYAEDLNEEYRFILSNESTFALLKEENIKLATFIPHSLLDRIDEIAKQKNPSVMTDTRPPVFVIKIYSSDVFFQEDVEYSKRKKVVGKVISFSIPGHDTDLPEMLPIIFQQSIDSCEKECRCGYWDYKGWADDGIRYLDRSSISNDLVLYGCYHLAPFAYLKEANMKKYNDGKIVAQDNFNHQTNLIILTGCFLSMSGSFSIVLTSIVFKSWREKPLSKVLFNFSTSILFQMTILTFISTAKFSQRLKDTTDLDNCVIFGGFLFYSVLVQLCWVTILAFLKFKRYVKVLGNLPSERFILKSFILCWGVPLIPVLIVCSIDKNSFAKSTICYPSGYSLYIGVLLPILTIIIFNLYIFVFVYFNVLCKPREYLRYINTRNTISHVRFFILLLFLLSSSWMFGIFSIVNADVICSYLFCFTATLQGFALFIHFVLLDPFAKNLWKRVIHDIICIKQTRYDFEADVSETKHRIR